MHVCIFLLLCFSLCLDFRLIVQEEETKPEKDLTSRKMGKARGVNSGGGESSLGYLFGSGESVSKPNMPTTTTTTTPTTTTTTGDKAKIEEEKKHMSAGVRGSPNNYLRTEGQNCGNFLTDRPSTKVHAAPGGGSSLGYLFGSGSGSGK